MLQKDTANVGRVWVDKSVSADSIPFDEYQSVSAGDSAFVTTLSVISSTSNLMQAAEGVGIQSDYVTFNDPLGAYMQVDDVCTVVAENGVPFKIKTVTTNGNVTTYEFGGAITIDGEHVLLEDIVITVTRSNDATVGDVVQVKVPASMIPLRSFQVDEDNLTMSITDAQPLSVFYRSRLKESVGSLWRIT